MACVDSTRKMREKLPVNRTAKNERDIITKNLWRPTKAARGFCGESVKSSRFGKDISSCPDILLLAAVGLIWDCALQPAAFHQG